MWPFPGEDSGSGSRGSGRHGHRSRPRKTRTKDLSHYATFGDVPRNHLVELLFHMERSMNPMHLESATAEELYACFYRATGRLPSCARLSLNLKRLRALLAVWLVKLKPCFSEA